MIQMISGCRAPTARHVTRTYLVDLNWLIERASPDLSIFDHIYEDVRSGGVHGNNRLGDRVASGSVAGAACAQYLLGDQVTPTPLTELRGRGLL